MKFLKLLWLLIVLAAFIAVIYVGFLWTVNRIYIPEGHSLMLTYKR